MADTRIDPAAPGLDPSTLARGSSTCTGGCPIPPKSCRTRPGSEFAWYSGYGGERHLPMGCSPQRSVAGRFQQGALHRSPPDEAIGRILHRQGWAQPRHRRGITRWRAPRNSTRWALAASRRSPRARCLPQALWTLAISSPRVSDFFGGCIFTTQPYARKAGGGYGQLSPCRVRRPRAQSRGPEGRSWGEHPMFAAESAE